jgi:hypothetical protein
MDPDSEEIKKLELKINELKNLQKVDNHKKKLKMLFEYNIMVIEDMLDKNKKAYESYENEHIPWDSSKYTLHSIIMLLEQLKTHSTTRYI